LLKEVMKLRNPDQAAITAVINTFRSKCPWHKQLSAGGNRDYMPDAIEGAIKAYPSRSADAVFVARSLGFTALAAKLSGESSENAHRPNSRAVTGEAFRL
jgi:hypothetical protein